MQIHVLEQLIISHISFQFKLRASPPILYSELQQDCYGFASDSGSFPESRVVRPEKERNETRAKHCQPCKLLGCCLNFSPFPVLNPAAPLCRTRLDHRALRVFTSRRAGGVPMQFSHLLQSSSSPSPPPPPPPSPPAAASAAAHAHYLFISLIIGRFLPME